MYSQREIIKNQNKMMRKLKKYSLYIIGGVVAWYYLTKTDGGKKMWEQIKGVFTKKDK